MQRLITTGERKQAGCRSGLQAETIRPDHRKLCVGLGDEIQWVRVLQRDPW